jgi:hypothetical protein
LEWQEKGEYRVVYVVSTTNWLWWIQSPKLFFFFFFHFLAVSDTMVHPKFKTLFIYLFIYVWMVLALMNWHVIEKCFKNFAPSKLGTFGIQTKKKP